MAQRPFVQKLSKQHAADVRKNINNMIPKNTDEIDVKPVEQVIEPYDYEDFLEKHESLLRSDPIRHILEFPVEDISVALVEKKIRTIEHVVPKEKIEDLPYYVRECINCYTRPWKVVKYTQRQYSRSCSQERLYHGMASSTYQKEFEIDKNYTTFDEATSDKVNSSIHSSRQSSLSSVNLCTDNFPQGQSWANFDLRRSVNDPLIPNLLDNKPSEQIDQINEIRRNNDRQAALLALFPDACIEDLFERRLPAEAPTEHMGHRVIVKCLQLRLELEVEPIFASMAIYDAKQRKKISENFYFDMNSDNLNRMLRTHVPCVDSSTQSSIAVFELTYPSNDLFLVIRLEKVLQGDIKDSVEPYMKDDKDKLREKAKSNASDYCERLGKYRMPFAWTGIFLNNVFNGESMDNKEISHVGVEKESGSLSSATSSNSLDRKSSTNSFDQLRRKANDMSGNFARRSSLEPKEKRQSWCPDDFGNNIELFRPVTITISSFFKQESDKIRDDDLYKFLPELKRPVNAMKKCKCIPGSIKLEISPLAEDMKNALTPELAKINPYPDLYVRPIKECLEFPAAPIYSPHYAYRNLLFVSPKELNFSARAGSARNIAVRVQLMAGEKQTDSLTAIFGKSSCPEYVNEAYTAVNYHNKCPAFYDEFKIALPANIQANHHLFFTIYHVSCQKKSQEMQSSVETPVGYTWLPLLENGKLNVGEFNLPVMVEIPPDNYSFISPNVQLPGTKWLDNHRAVFTLNIDAVTSIHTLDANLDNFFAMCEYLNSGKIPPRIGEVNMENEMKKCVLKISNAERVCFVKNLHLVMDKLIELLVTNYKINGHSIALSSTIFEVICLVCTNLNKELDDDPNAGLYRRQGVLSTYVQFQCKIPHPPCSSVPLARNRNIADEILSTLYSKYDYDSSVRLLHEELVLCWINSDGDTIELSMTNSWFLFELIVKSMIEHLDHMKAFNASRKQRFPKQYLDHISTLIHLVTIKIIDYHYYKPLLSQALNASLGFFIFDLLSIIDRGFVFKLINSYYKIIMPKTISTPDLTSYKISFVAIICTHEHFVALNLPFGTPYTIASLPCNQTLSIKSSSKHFYEFPEHPLHVKLNPEFRQQHFLIGLILCELSAVLKTPHSQLQAKVISCIHNIIESHDLDPRFNKTEARARIAALYLPLLNIVVDILPQLYQCFADSYDLLQNFGRPSEYNCQRNFGPSAIRPEVSCAISGTDHVKIRSSLSDSFRHLLVCFIWVLKNLHHTILYHWLLGLSSQRVYQTLQVLALCISLFEYKGQKRLPVTRGSTSSFRKPQADLKGKLEEYILGTNSARTDLINRRKDRNNMEKLRWRKDQMPYRSQFTDTNIKTEQEFDLSYYIEASQASEISLVILDVLETVTQVATNSEVHNNLLGTVLKVMLHALSLNQSTLVLENLFASQRSLISKFPNLIFDEETDVCADLCLLLLKYCSSKLPGIRSQAAASLYLLMRQNFEIGNNFARVKMQVTMSLSSLVGTSSVFNDQTLRRALKTILVYGESDIDLQDTTFPEQVQDLLFNLHMILSDTVKMKEYQEDPEMLLDLMHRIAKGYQNNPDLRLTWLQNMAKKHCERGNHTEAAMCYVHSAALVSEYLRMIEYQKHLPVGAVSFQSITPNSLFESAVSDDVVSPSEDGICLGNYFTESGLRTLLEEAANAFQIAGMYEVVNEVYKILTPIYEASRDFKKLGTIYGKLQEAYNRITQLEGKRVFGTYFRVGFYGSKFGDLDQQEFIYKEPTLTKLPEIFIRLQNFYADRFGSQYVHIIKDSNTVDINTLDPENAYIQITYVEPYFEPYEMRYRESYFERNFNIKRFIFSTPFTKSGKAHGELLEQCKRKTILTTANHFPYVKTRIQVISRQQIILEPIEVAIEDIQKKTFELTEATNQEPPDPKILQMVLQGCIGTTVNQGPIELATVFLSNLADGITVPSKLQNKLRLSYREFAKRCSDALIRNGNLILPDQGDYQRELERNNDFFISQIMPLITLTPLQTKGIFM